MTREEVKQLLEQIRDEKSRITDWTNHVKVAGAAEDEDVIYNLKFGLAHLVSARKHIEYAAKESGYVPPSAVDHQGTEAGP